MYELTAVQELLQNYAEMLSRVLKVNVEICDTALIRRAASGKMRRKIGKTLQCHVSQLAISSGKPQIISQPREDPICQNCAEIHSCKETFELSMPILVGETVVGAIGFVCYTKQQKNHITSDFDAYYQMLQEVATLISFQFLEKRHQANQKITVDFLEEIAAVLQMGLLFFTENQEILEINSYAKSMFQLEPPQLQQASLHFPKNTGELQKNVRCQLELGESSWEILGNLYPFYGEQLTFLLLFSQENCKAPSKAPKKPSGVARIIGQSPVTEKLKQSLAVAGKVHCSALFQGHPGCDYDFFIQVYHQESGLKGDCVTVNCLADSSHLHEFILALQGEQKIAGKFAKAMRGIVVLAEIEHLSLSSQEILLEILRFRRSHAKYDKVFPCFLGCTHSDLHSLCQKSTFLWGLYYELATMLVQIPALSERRADLPALASFYMATEQGMSKGKIASIPAEIWDYISRQAWQQNQDELKCFCRQIEISLQYQEVFPLPLSEQLEENKNKTLNLAENEKETILYALEIYGNSYKSKEIIAEKLGIGIATLYKKLKTYEISS